MLVVVVLASGGAAFAWMRTRPEQSATPKPAETTAVVSPGASHQTTAAAVPEGVVVAREATPPAEVPEESPQSPVDDAVAAAAVPYPDAPAVEAESIAQLKPKHKYVAITLDDGYGFQPEMLELLQKYDARCTTFLLGEWMKNNTKTVKKLDEAGFEIANHTWDHKTLTNLSDSQVTSELERTQKVISAVTGNQAPYMRPPGGGTNKRVKQLSADLGYTTIMWSRTFADSSKHASPENSYHYVMEYGGGVKPGDIILCHWGSKNTLAAMKRILPELKAEGYEFVTVSELIADSQSAKSGAAGDSATTEQTPGY